MLSNKKLPQIVTELFIRVRKISISLFYYTFITQSYFAVPKDIILDSLQNFIMRILNKTRALTNRI